MTMRVEDSTRAGESGRFLILIEKSTYDNRLRIWHVP